MPAMYTHYEFGRYVLDNLNKDIKKTISKNLDYYDMFNQGFDNLYYYLPKWRKYRELGRYCHHHYIKTYFKNVITYIYDNNLQNDSEVTNMLYGFINHLTMDSIMHPLINYQTKRLKISHSSLEIKLDRYLYEIKYHKDFQKEKMYKELVKKLKYGDNLINTFDSVFLSTYNQDKIGKIINRSHNLGYIVYKYFVFDSFGIKTFFYKIYDFFTPNKDFRYSEHTYYEKSFNTKFFNDEHKEWKYKKESYYYSWNELYEYAIKNATKLIELANKAIYDQKYLNKFLKEYEKVNVKNI